MASSSLPVKIFTVGVFLTLMGGFVAYKGGTFDTKPERPAGGVYPVFPGGKQSNSIAPASFLKAEQVLMMSSSKSAAVFFPGESEPKKKTPEKELTVIMSSSKSGEVFRPGPDTPKKTPAILMGSSKSAVIFNVPADTSKNSQKKKK
jgi:hypothetical protein